MVIMRDPDLNDEPPPEYDANNTQVTLTVQCGGIFVNEPTVTYVGGTVYKFDYVEYKFVSMGGLKQLSEHVGWVGPKKYFTKTKDGFNELHNNAELQALCFNDRENLKEVEIYIECEGIKSSSGDGTSDSDYVMTSILSDSYDDCLFDEFVDTENEQGEDIAGDMHREEKKTESVECLGDPYKEWDFTSDLHRDAWVDEGNEERAEENKGGLDKIQEDGKENEGRINESSEDFSDSLYDLGESDYESTEDDLLFDNYVDKNAEWGGYEASESVQRGDNESGEDNVVDSGDIFMSDHGSDVEGPSIRAPLFNNVTLYDPHFTLGMIFASKKDLRIAIHSHAIKSKRNVKITKNDKTRMHVKCVDERCQWKLHATKRVDECTFQVREYVNVHTCPTTFKVKNVRSNWLSGKYLNKFVSDPDRSVKGFRVDAIEEMRCQVSKTQAYRAKKKALQMIQGEPEDQYKLLWDYANETKRANPGSTVILGTDQSSGANRFDRYYVCLYALKVGFLAGCRPVICIDGCHLKSSYGGVLLSAVGIDPNNNIYPIAYAVVCKEDGDTWEWFLTLIKLDLNIEDDMSWTFMSDKQKGLLHALWNVFPTADYKHCVRHLHSNFRNAGFRGGTLKIALWNAARATTPNEFKHRMKQLSDLDENAASWLNDKPPHEWSRSHFSTYPRCDLLLNNGCECFNSCILEARDKQIVTMLQWIMEYLMKRMQKNRDRANKTWKGKFCPKIEKILHRNIEKQAECIPIKSNDRYYQVSCYDDSQYSVDLVEGTCGCRRWDLSGIPCIHAVSAILCQWLNVEDFTHKCYTVETYKRVYEPVVVPINGRNEWDKTEFIPPLPPLKTRSSGRPKKSRKREPDEVIGKTTKRTRGKPQQTESNKLKRQQISLNCKKCGNKGHNSRTCDRQKKDEGVGTEIPDNFSQVTMDLESICLSNTFDTVGGSGQKLQVRKKMDKGKGPMLPTRKSPRKQNKPLASQEQGTSTGIEKLTTVESQGLGESQEIRPSCIFLKEPTLKPGPSMFNQFQEAQQNRNRIVTPASFIETAREVPRCDDKETPAIVKGGRKYVKKQVAEKAK